jgi:hypothetical protein
MAPLGKQFDLDAPSAAFKAEWMSPSNYAFTVLLLVGGDVVSRALAQLAGGRITPVAFSFGSPSPFSFIYTTSLFSSLLMDTC